MLRFTFYFLYVLSLKFGRNPSFIRSLYIFTIDTQIMVGLRLCYPEAPSGLFFYVLFFSHQGPRLRGISFFLISLK